MKAFRFLFLASVTLLAAGSAQAQNGVVASIKPIHSLVASVMEGVGEPAIIVHGAGSPHTYSLKPSQARDIERARTIFWVGHALEAFLEKPIETLGTGATVVELGDVGGLTMLEPRQGGTFEAHRNDEDEAADAAEHHEHEHGKFDMHLWLDPQNATAMVRKIAATLSETDPANASRYQANAEATIARLDTLSADIDEMLKPVKGRPYIVFHDAYQYFENRFAIPAAGSITVSPEVMPGAERVAEIRAKLGETGAACVFSEPQFEPKLIAVLTEGTDARSGVLDPLGADLEAGPDLYFDLMRNMARSLHDCLAAAS